MDTLGRLIEKLLHQKDLWEGYCRYWIIANWGILVGEKIAEVSDAREVNGALLRVTVRDAIWAYHLCLLKPRIIRKIKTRFPNAAVRDIYFQVGDLSQKEKPPGKGEYTTVGGMVRAQQNEDDFRQKIRFLRERCAVPQRNKEVKK